MEAIEAQRDSAFSEGTTRRGGRPESPSEPSVADGLLAAKNRATRVLTNIHRRRGHRQDPLLRDRPNSVRVGSKRGVGPD